MGARMLACESCAYFVCNRHKSTVQSDDKFSFDTLLGDELVDFLSRFEEKPTTTAPPLITRARSTANLSPNPPPLPRRPTVTLQPPPPRRQLSARKLPLATASSPVPVDPKPRRERRGSNMSRAPPRVSVTEPPSPTAGPAPGLNLSLVLPPQFKFSPVAPAAVSGSAALPPAVAAAPRPLKAARPSFIIHKMPTPPPKQ